MDDDPALSDEAARAAARLGGLPADERTAGRIRRSVEKVTASAGDFRAEIRFGDTPQDFLRLMIAAGE